MQSVAKRLDGQFQPLQTRLHPWELAGVFKEVCETLTGEWKPRPLRREDRYERTLIEDDTDPHRAWEAAAIIVDQFNHICGCLNADWSTIPTESPGRSHPTPSQHKMPSGILQSELVCGMMLIHRLLYDDY